MFNDEPLQLIVPDADYYEADEYEGYLSLKQIGVIIIFSVWAIFLVSVNSFFEIWRFVIYPLKFHSETSALHKELERWFLTVDYYVVSMWCLYVVFWWWAVFSWIGLKLFRQSKGLQT